MDSEKALSKMQLVFTIKTQQTTNTGQLPQFYEENV
jgi:hypothetical protein